MIWKVHDALEFFRRFDRAWVDMRLYVWGAYGMTFAVMLAELVLAVASSRRALALRRRHRRSKTTSARSVPGMLE